MHARDSIVKRGFANVLGVQLYPWLRYASTYMLLQTMRCPACQRFTLLVPFRQAAHGPNLHVQFLCQLLHENAIHETSKPSKAKAEDCPTKRELESQRPSHAARQTCMKPEHW